IVMAAIDSSFFPVLASGRVGLLATFTDTFDGLFAIDFLSLTVVTATGMTVALIDSNNGFGIGVPDGGALPGPLPNSIPANATGTGFDETIASVSFTPALEPSTIALFGIGTLALLGYGLRRSDVRWFARANPDRHRNCRSTLPEAHL
ncbi:MAG: PEP-CTERM sorting domain-containing protein, partial [Pseudomonadota bacterium]|nr:PEP-CTERM sorting domain-containing protein [Pseudomonadota bacterium]